MDAPTVITTDSEPQIIAVGYLKAIRRTLVLILLILLGLVIYFAQDMVMPIVLGFLFALTLRPVVRALDRRGIPAFVGGPVVVIAVTASIAFGGWALSGPVAELVNSAPAIGRELQEKLSGVRDGIEAVQNASKQVEDIADGVESPDEQEVVIRQPALLNSAASTLVSGATSIAVALVLALFFLSTGTLFYEKLVGLMPSLTEKKRALRLVYDVERQVSRYLFTITLINIGLGAVIGTGLMLYGMPNAWLWGALATVLNFLPFIGALVGVVCLAGVSLVSFDTLGAAMIPPAIYFASTTIEGNFVTPMIVGRRLELNIVAVFLTVVVWGWLWGIAGALMAVPILVAVKVFCDNFEGLQPLGEFLSGRRMAEANADE